jgi:hypothetical protein
VQFLVPEGVARPQWIACSLLEPEAGLVWGGNADCALDPPVARVSAPPGTYRLVAGAEGGLSGGSELVIGAQETSAAAAILLLRRTP